MILILKFLDLRLGIMSHLDNVDRFTGDEVDVLLVVLHAGDVVCKSGAFFTAIVGGVVAEQVGDFDAIGWVLMDTQLDVAAELNNENYI